MYLFLIYCKKLLIYISFIYFDSGFKWLIYLFIIRFGVIDECIKECFDGLILLEVMFKKWLFIVDFEIFDGIICVEGYIVCINYLIIIWIWFY